ncbi:hypothetical protein ES288_D11G309800v1 [Gossypium darwinii]|uniref:DUF4283 domain-containing protein n=1 Tax=Gossypium darwinii TaxID=34276 RepID=A0A5D2AT44_GOSDA|nr:hypothetical protein ES288_D11G309800v1 [Gossypium darwinii]
MESGFGWISKGGRGRSVYGGKIFNRKCYSISGHEDDRRQSLASSRWHDNFLYEGEEILLVFVDFWVQIHDFLSGLVLEVMARQFGNFIGTFLDNYMKTMGTGYRGFIRIGVRIDVMGLLKRRKKIILSQNHSLYARFQYK